MDKNKEIIFNTMKVVNDFPTKGISFKDITPIFASKTVFNLTIDEMANLVKDYNFDVIVGLESRGFWFALPLAQKLHLPFIPVRKAGKLPRKTIFATYSLEYGNDKIEVHAEDIKPGSNVLVVDDIIATGGTILATKKILDQLQAKADHVLVFGYLKDLPEGLKKIEESGMKVHSLFQL